jgi:hypothetical protein
MFVRWKVRQKPPRLYSLDRRARQSLTAVLVRSARVDGKPRQQVVAYLGHFNLDMIDQPAWRKGFWERADRRLADLALDYATREKIEAALQARIPCPTDEEVRASKERFDKEMGALAESLRRPS